VADGGHFRTIADIYHVTEATVHKCAHRFIDAVSLHLYPEIVQFPTGAAAANTRSRFYQLANMPLVAGECEFAEHSSRFGNAACVDGTHVGCRAPLANERAYVNRHHTLSIN